MTLNIKTKYLFLLGILCLIIFTYPASPVLFELFLFNNKITYISYLVFGIFLVYYGFHNYASFKNFLVTKYYQFTYLFLTALLPIVYFATNNDFLIREFITLIFFYYTFTCLKKLDFLILARAIVYSYAAITLLSEITGLYYYYDPDILGIFGANNISLNHNNPILNRQRSGDFVYYLLYYVAVIPFESQSTFIRLPMIFTEPTYCAAYTFGLLGVSFIDKKLLYRQLIIFILLTALLLSRSTLLFILIFIAVIIVLFISKRLYKTFGIVLVSCLIFAEFLFKNLLKMLPNGKFEEYLFYKNHGAFFNNYDKFSLWGDASEKLGSLSYGIETLFVTHGVLLSTTYVLCLLILLYKSFFYLVDIRLNLAVRVVSFLSIFVTCMFAIKFTQMFIIFPMFIFLYLTKLNKLKLSN